MKDLVSWSSAITEAAVEVGLGPKLSSSLQIHRAALAIALPLLLAIPLDRFRMLLAVLFPVLRMRTPLPLAGLASFCLETRFFCDGTKWP